jgi:hypothetical protein
MCFACIKSLEAESFSSILACIGTVSLALLDNCFGAGCVTSGNGCIMAPRVRSVIGKVELLSVILLDGSVTLSWKVSSKKDGC